MMNQVQKGTFYMMGSVLTITVMYLFSDWMFIFFDELDPSNTMFWGIPGALIITAPFFVGTRRVRKGLISCAGQEAKTLLLVSFLTAIGAFLWWYTIEQTSSGIVALISKTEPIFALFLGVLFLGESIRRSEWLGIGIAFLGFLLISTLEGEVTLVLVVAILVSRFFYALQSFLVKKWSPNLDAYSFSYLRMCLLFLFTAPVFLLRGSIHQISFEALLSVSSAMILGGIIAKVFYFEAHNYLPISKLNMFLILQTALVVIGASLIFGDPLSLQKVLGTVLILTGLAYFYRVQLIDNQV